jgi:predicted transcriptional regulator
MLHEVDLLDRKHNASPNPKREAEKRAAKAAIAATLRAGGAMRATAIAAVNDMSVQRVSAMLRQMVAEETVTRSTEGKVTTFTLK